MLVRKTSGLGGDSVDTYFDADGGDAVEAHEWRCVRTINGTLDSDVSFLCEPFTFTDWLEFFLEPLLLYHISFELEFQKSYNL